MNKSFIYFLVIILFVSSVYAQVIEVNSDIQKAIDKSSDGDIIIIKPGVYETNLVIKKDITITSSDVVNTIISSGVKDKPVIYKEGSGKIENLTISYGGDKWDCNGIYITYSDAVIRNNIIKNNSNYGIYTSFFKGSIENNIITKNKFDGIKLYNSEALVSDNIIDNNGDDGIEALHSKVKILSNKIYDNKEAGIELWFDNMSAITGNTINKNYCPVKFATLKCNPVMSDNRLSDNTVDTIIELEKKVTESIPVKLKPGQPSIKKEVKKSFINDTSVIKKTMDYLLLKDSDFNLEHRSGGKELDLKIFSRLISNTLNSSYELKNFSDSLIQNIGSAYKTCRTALSIEYDTLPLFKETGHRRKIRLNHNFPDELENYINIIYSLTEKYNNEYDKIKNSFADTEFEFITEELSDIFSQSGSRPSTFREELKFSDEDKRKQLALKKLLKKVDLSKLKEIGLDIIYIADKIKEIDPAGFKKKDKQVLYKKTTRYGDIIIKGAGDDAYSNSDAFINIDLGGNDNYDNKIAVSNPDKLVSLYFDFSGNDVYRSDTHSDIVFSFFGVSYLYDGSGDDIYTGNNNCIASTSFGISILEDLSGADQYKGSLYCMGAGSFGIGLLIDKSGNDIYSAGAYGQGFGTCKGIGIILDSGGSDYYLSGNQLTDSIRYYAHNITMTQGFGYGIRPYIPGGLGMLIDKEGNDFYQSDIFGQGSSYWMSIGALIDYKGSDNYTSYRYSQGAGVHYGIGNLIDLDGDDNYTSFIVSQACGHDFSYGLLYDRSGNDYYRLKDMGQGAGNANGIGLLIDEKGNDGYFSLGRNYGWGNFLKDRKFGSIGIFYDVEGSDKYMGLEDKTARFSGKYGVFCDE